MGVAFVVQGCIMLNMVDKASDKEYLPVQRAARYIGVSAQTLRRWDAEGKLKSVRHPGNDYRYYKRADLEPLRLEYRRAEQANPGAAVFPPTAKNAREKKHPRTP